TNTNGLPNIATNLRSNFTREQYVEAVKRVKRYIAAGDIYQANISQRFEANVDTDAWTLYQSLRNTAPAPFGAYLGFPESSVLSASPEQFLRVENDFVETRPMKGTRPRGANNEDDIRLGRELAASEKDRAENIMIVDLLRNDLGRVCQPGTIRVPELFTVEKYPNVHQLVSSVTGRLRPEHDAIDLLKACFPGGSVTGAPKIRAMEIIDEIEPVQRGVYCGAIGYIGFDGSMQLSIPIRTMVAKGQRVYLQVGGGIVADSDPDAEYQETLDKARGGLEALGISGLQTQRLGVS
ncbi:MAG: aminodeoxychorismate synthase component I, partial [Dehalococcoidia bacterium]|nr:aminodeoxychorismate synthase component I [Dehalococcoidia bacterium]